MVGPLFVLGVAVSEEVIAVILYAVILAKGRRVGTKGIVQRSHLRCPKCQQEFDYDWVPGASFTAVRLGPARYMACPLCHRWSAFDLYGHLVARVPAGSSGTPSASPPMSRPPS